MWRHLFKGGFDRLNHRRPTAISEITTPYFHPALVHLTTPFLHLAENHIVRITNRPYYEIRLKKTAEHRKLSGIRPLRRTHDFRSNLIRRINRHLLFNVLRSSSYSVLMWHRKPRL